MPNRTDKHVRRYDVKRWIFHLIFWSIIALMYTVSYNRLDKENGWVLVVKDLLALITIFYSTGYYIIPKCLLKGRYVLTLLWVLVIYMWWGMLTYVGCMVLLEFLEPGKRLSMYAEIVTGNGLTGLFNVPKLPFYVLDFIYLVSLPLGLKVMQAFVQVRYKKAELELENTALELNFLKSQINPHFLFNTLNNIYILVSDNHPSSADYISKLSSIMRYMLHDSNNKAISLADEKEFIENYFELEKLRINPTVHVSFEFIADADDYKIVPLILFPFIENAFKYGPKSSNKNAWLTVRILVNSGQLNMTVANGYSKVPKSNLYVGGIGITNAKRRLELNYVNRYELNIKELEDSFCVKLALTLHNLI